MGLRHWDQGSCLSHKRGHGLPILAKLPCSVIHYTSLMMPSSSLQVTILFSDIVGFTELCSKWPTEHVVQVLDALFSRFDDLCDK